MKDISSILNSLGFLDSEIKTYTAALEHGPSTVIDLTKHTHLSRQATYVVIDQLTKRGLMSSVIRGKKKYYVAEDPDKLLSYAQRREMEIKDRIKDLEDALPELKLKVGGERPVVKLFEGKEGIRTIFTDLASIQGNNIRELTDREAMKVVLSDDDLAPLRDMLKKAGTNVKAIYTGQPGGKAITGERYFLPEELSGFKSDIIIYANKIVFLTFEGKMNSVVIENDLLARSMKVLFDLAIKGSKDFPSD